MKKHFTQSQQGVEVRLEGEVSKASLEKMAQECNSGACSCACDTTLKEQVRRVEVEGEDGNVTLMIQGDNLDAGLVAKAMESCDFE